MYTRVLRERELLAQLGVPFGVAGGQKLAKVKGEDGGGNEVRG